MDFRLKVFIEAASSLNFTKAAEKLFITQPAVSKNIKELELEYGCRLFERRNGNLLLTREGAKLLARAHEIINIYSLAQEELNELKGEYSGELRIAASTTIAQYVLPGVIAKFLKKYPNVKITLYNKNSAEVEHMLEDGSVDLGMVEGNHKNMNLKYTAFKKDELVLVTTAKNKGAKQQIPFSELRNLPLVLRENGSGTLDVICKALMERGLKRTDLNILTQMASTEGIKNFLNEYKEAYAILSVCSIVKELKYSSLNIIDVDDIQINRNFYLVQRYGSPDMPLITKFITFCYKE